MKSNTQEPRHPRTLPVRSGVAALSTMSEKSEQRDHGASDKEGLFSCDLKTGVDDDDLTDDPSLSESEGRVDAHEAILPTPLSQ